MADYIYPKVSILDTVYDVAKIFKKKGAGEYSSTQGYTVTTGTNRVHFFTAIKSNNNVAVARVMGEQNDNGDVGGTISKDRELGHANDCAYYDSGFFIAQGGGDNDNTNIKRLNNSLEHVATYKYKPTSSNNCDALTSVTGIAYISGGYFALSQGMRVSICKLDTDKGAFTEVSRFMLTGVGNHLSRGSSYERLSQGIYYAHSKLYKAFSYKDSSGAIKQNDIGIFELNSSIPTEMSKAKFETSYSCDKTGKALFEVEALSSPDAGNTMYMLANVYDGGEKDKLYRVSFS